MSPAFTVDFANAGSIYVFTNATHAFGVVAAGGECTVNGTFNAVIQQPPVVLPPWEDW
jgi:hypothetical protein